MRKLRVLRTGIGSSPSLPVIDGLIDNNCIVYGADADKDSFGFHYDRLKKSFVIPKAGDTDFVAAVLSICKENNITVIIPAVDEELIVLSANNATFKEAGITVVVSNFSVIETFNHKVSSNNSFCLSGLTVPTASLDSSYVVKETGYPLLAKKVVGRGGDGIYKINTYEEAKYYESTMAIIEGLSNYIFQEYIQGDEFTADVLCDFDGNFVTGCIRKRIKTESGICSKAKVVKDKTAEKEILRLLEDYKFIGPINVQYIKDKNGVNHYIDLNPRYAGTVALSIEAGCPMVKSLVDMLNSKYILRLGFIHNKVKMYRYWKELYVKGGK